MVRPVTERIFHSPEPFAAALEAERFAHDHCLKVGPMESNKPRALDHRKPPHWSKLGDRADSIAGFIDGDQKRGPVRVWIDEDKLP
jgi:hypothetical protein